MKRYIHSEEDWNTSTSDEMVNAFREIMANNIEYQDNPQVGLFWYDTENAELFGVRTADPEDVPFQKTSLFNKRAKTCRPLHYKIWEREYHRGKDARFRGDYTLVPRGRVFYVEDVGFIVIVGDWIDEYPEAKDLIIEEFMLPEDAVFKKDVHWNLGHGWSDKFI